MAPAAINTKLEGHNLLTNMLHSIHSPHAVSRLRTARLARSPKPFSARGGWLKERCAGCRLAITHCLCNLRPKVATRAGMCLLMSDTEALKPSNTGWLIADVVADTFAFEWTRTAVDPALLALLADPNGSHSWFIQASLWRQLGRCRQYLVWRNLAAPYPTNGHSSSCSMVLALKRARCSARALIWMAFRC